MSIEKPSFEQPTSKNESLRVEIREKLKEFLKKHTPLSTLHQNQTNVSRTNLPTETSDKMINSAVEEPEKTEVAK
ncbi:hypothetical protein IPN41_04340 [Candidatus Falkowbacteria bacterium]|nr:MAG: hypothetical protein IPN41_04340 [Candidatus Falkowbacteria bacterium]